jgi:hypothetical protein
MSSFLNLRDKNALNTLKKRKEKKRKGRHLSSLVKAWCGLSIAGPYPNILLRKTADNVPFVFQTLTTRGLPGN